MQKKDSVFNDIKVADFSWNVAAPMATKFLADYGATVVRVESHTQVDLVRVISPFKDNTPGVNNSGTFARFSSSKLGITLNLNSPKAFDVAMRLIEWSDVVVENFVPGMMKRWKLDYETVAKVKPDIIYLSSSQLGQTGPFAHYAGYGGQATALSGFNYICGKPGSEPLIPYNSYTDFINPPLAVAAILAALDYRRRTGKGIYMDQSQAEGAIHYLSPVIMDFAINKRILGKSGNRLPYAAPHGVYPCSGDDRWIAIAVFNDHQWHAFCEVLQGAEWINEQKFATLTGRKQHEDELDANIAEWTKQRSAEENFQLLQAKEVPSGVVKTGKDLCEDPQLAHRCHFIPLESQEIGERVYERPPFDLSKAPPCITPAPALGEHNEYVYRELLGFSDDEIADLLIEGVITTDADLPEYRPTL